MMKRIIFLLLPLAIFLGISGCATPQKKTQAKEIIDLFREDRKEEALARVTRYISQYGDWWGYNAKGNILQGMGRYSEALIEYKKSLKATPLTKRCLLYNNIAKISLDFQEYNSALYYYQRAKDLSKGTNKYLYDMKIAWCLFYKNEGDIKPLEHVYNVTYPLVNLIEDSLPDNDKGSAYISMSDIAFQLGRFDDSLKFTKKVVEVRETDGTVLSLANLLAYMGRTIEAKEQFTGVNQAKVSPANLAAWFWVTGDEIRTEEYLKRSLEEMQTPEGRKIWKGKMSRSSMFPNDWWAKARDKPWFQKLIKAS